MFFSEKNNGKKDKNGELLLFDCLYSISPEDVIIRRAVMFRAEKHFCFVFIFFFFVNGHAIKVGESRMNCTTTLVAYRHRFFIVPYLLYGVCVCVWYNKLRKFIKQKWVHFIKRDRKEIPFAYIQQLTLFISSMI